VGGGPAGLEAGIVAAARGHRVDLYERDQLGGQFRLASKPPMKEGMKVPHDYLLSKTRVPNLHVHLGEDVDLGMVMAQAPDVVVVATGAAPVIPDIAGLEDLEYTTGHDVFSGARVAGPRVLIIGGGMVGVETAEYLATQGNTVTVLEMLSEIARDMEAITRALLLKRIAHLPVQLLTDTVVRRFEKEQVIIETNGTEACLPRFDSVVFTVGTRSVDTLSTPLRRQGFEVLVVGDSKNPRQVLDAIREGFEAGLAV
jgi:pyruvate/2-oxoglutarate dehydrogenase complex dihydrolipoamide dehydrogenase (E3) component